MHPPPMPNAPRCCGVARLCTHAALSALATFIFVACDDPGCPEGYVLKGDYCRNLANLLAVDAGVDAASQPSTSGSGGTTPIAAGASASTGVGGAGGSKPAPIDPTIEWMCMKNNLAECTSCKQDADCPKRVCEQGFCMDCRDASQCGAANSCVSNRCVPERKPSSVWQVSGGGQTSATGLKLQLSIGMPTPTTNAAIGGFKMNAALGAGNF